MNDYNTMQNAGHATFGGREVRSPKASERQGSVTSKQSDRPSVKVKTYSVIVSGGALKIAGPPRKVRSAI